MTATGLVKQASPRWAKEGARAVFRSVGSRTAASRPLPDYLIIGTKRGGTTSLWRYLLEHPAVLPMYPAAENVKSPHYFDIHWAKGQDWYRSHLPSRRQRARVERNYGVCVSGDASPYYMFHPVAAARAATTCPAAKVIVLLRNPVDRAYSHYRERQKNGTEALPFRAAIEAEQTRLDGEVSRILNSPTYYSEQHDFSSYLARGRYLEQLEDWFARFPEERILALRSEDLYTNPQAAVAAVQDFLGIPRVPLRQPQAFNGVPAHPMRAEDRAWLADYYRDSVAALERRLGRSFEWNL
jgi:hypothetical protein